MTKKYIFVILIILLIGLFFRIYHIEFGLPHSFYADEPEFVEPAIKYTYELRDIVNNNNYYKLIPVSFVYGTLPSYLLTVFIIAFSKLSGILHIVFEKMHLYIVARLINALIPFLVINFSLGFLSLRLFSNNEKSADSQDSSLPKDNKFFHLRNKLIAIFSIFLFSLNWKFIAHAHYFNADLFLTMLLSLSLVTAFLYYEKKKEDTLYTVLTGILLGAAVGTKITALIGFPFFFYLYLLKKDYKGFIALIGIIFATFIFTNPFSLILFEEFSFRIFEMFTLEAGLVFDSVDMGFYKYILAILFISTPFVFLFSLYGIFKSIKEKTSLPFHYVLIGNIIVYLLFFSLQSRRVDRWLLPILPIIILYAAYGIARLKEVGKSFLFIPLIALTLAIYFYYPIKLLTQFQRNTPKSAAYIWMKNNINPFAKKLVYTEEGLDPMNKLNMSKVYKVEVYEAENAQYFYPVDPKYFDYIVISSRPLQNYKRVEVRQEFPHYYKVWNDFEKKVNDPSKFKLIKEFTLSRPNLIPLSDVFIYKNLNPAENNLLLWTNN